MSAADRSLREASQRLTDHLNRPLNRTITHRRLIVAIEPGVDYATIQFREAGRPVPVRLRTQYGHHDLTISLRCALEAANARRVNLRTVWYRHTLQPEGHRDPVFRWEYVAEPEGDYAFWARHHLQGPAPIDVGSQYVSLNDPHVPTGPVQIEEIIRFCINDLGVSPLSDDWDAILRESAEISRQATG